jgi:DNA-binding HxlR family transcriptional regulator
VSSSSEIVDAKPLIELFHHRWAVPLLAELERAGGHGRFVGLTHRLGVAQDSLRRTLAAALERGYVMRNPGYGHPLRPDYVLGPRGRLLAPACVELMDELDRLDAVSLGLRKWSMPVVYVLGTDGAGGVHRFGDLRAHLPAATPRALSLALDALGTEQLIERADPGYRVGPRATPLRPTLRELVRLGRAA